MKMDRFLQSSDFPLPECLQKNFDEVFRHGKIGLMEITPKDMSVMKHYYENDFNYGYQFTLKIPYAGKRLHWDLIFNPEDMLFAPDFNFNDDTFHLSHDMDIVVNNVPSLVNWNVCNSKSLVSVLQEFLNLYKKQQVHKLQNENLYSHLSAQYEPLITEGIVESSDVEICLENTVAHFLFSIKLDVFGLPEYKLKDENDMENPGDNTVVLKVSYLKLDGSRVNTSLQITPRIDQLLGNNKSLRIPPTYGKNTNLAEYVLSVIKHLTDHISKIQTNFDLKHKFVSYVNYVLRANIVECDAVTFSKIILHCEVDDYLCPVCIEIGDDFPEKQPIVSLHSIHCTLAKKPCKYTVDNYPYSPRWAPEEMLRKLLEHLRKKIVVFQNHKH